MEVLINKDWDYTLSKDGEIYLLSVVSGSIGLYEIEIHLNPAEIEGYQKLGQDYIDNLVSQINNNPKEYLSRNS